MSVAGWLDRVVHRLSAYDERLLRRRASTRVESGCLESPPNPQRWRDPPRFYSKHPFDRGDALAAIFFFFVGGFSAAHAFADGRSLEATK